MVICIDCTDSCISIYHTITSICFDIQLHLTHLLFYTVLNSVDIGVTFLPHSLPTAERSPSNLNCCHNHTLNRICSQTENYQVFASYNFGYLFFHIFVSIVSIMLIKRLNNIKYITIINRDICIVPFILISY